ncbi:MAG: glucose-1-phosphate thymidylyltransferase RfbA [Candidatus Marinimicrobia bacterium]|jgi:glucose-1-phosphate thymidylyltransferase|nr:glucose-1-phosphate thymidylyltransferase RfbA [Candidatus Neomarinimicrobiota bacterium]MBT4851034.1 glucose-1-phosphate thymidylyltransferase RfbA [Candidatus Neomarinimicrobiota bacterium]MBT6713610.1 glucose-1-phosphate thymidylyltransferase RfbA [Candidatus Neomarinimicrobiota bacterium]MBT7021631.1 glucose-1-phosphate thymidylyltransferase RfbA [Candidatus Neomarinimicrobiota bacterium]MBT7884638.1 glucose-1-phosphate thymidylyltransferase RfbA [Candidatus Neomarinimicrobiota bacterium
MKGIILAGGAGTRLYPLTEIASKQLLPVYDKPMIYYPLSTLMLMNIQDVLIISTPEDTPKFEKLFGDGSRIGMNISYKVQPEPKGIAQAFIIGKEFIGEDDVTLILGDNLFYGHGYLDYIKSKLDAMMGAIVFGYWVKDPERYGVVQFDDHGKVLNIEEKPKIPKTNYAVPGLYIYDNQVVEIAKNMKPSARGELEITDINQEFLNRDQLHVEILGRGVAWLDTGTHKSLLEAGTFIETIETRQGLKVGCLEEIAYAEGFINISEFKKLIEALPLNEYRSYLEGLLKR